MIYNSFLLTLFILSFIGELTIVILSIKSKDTLNAVLWSVNSIIFLAIIILRILVMCGVLK